MSNENKTEKNMNRLKTGVRKLWTQLLTLFIVCFPVTSYVCRVRLTLVINRFDNFCTFRSKYRLFLFFSHRLCRLFYYYIRLVNAPLPMRARSRSVRHNRANGWPARRRAAPPYGRGRIAGGGCDVTGALWYRVRTRARKTHAQIYTVRRGAHTHA